MPPEFFSCRKYYATKLFLDFDNRSRKKSPELTTKWNEVLDINLKACFMCSREAIKKMLRQKDDRHGTGHYSIINISRPSNPCKTR
jgi:NAD(P)-dependent dehydrogenase (short-subunit alcohol dehydrogenase family)